MVDKNAFTIDILKRSSRRSISLHVTQEGKLEVRAPYLVPMFLLNRFVASKREWIIKTKQLMHKRLPIVNASYQEGSIVRLAGIPYTIHITDGNTIVLLGSKILFPKKFLRHPKDAMERWCRKYAKKYLTLRANHFAHTMNVTYKKISIRDTTTRWGSCSSSGTISFSYRLILADTPIIDYVVIHELAHTVHHNHAKIFWDVVSLYYPEHKKARAWLHNQGHTLRL